MKSSQLIAVTEFFVTVITREPSEAKGMDKMKLNTWITGTRNSIDIYDNIQYIPPIQYK
jgi:hypothetical protein